MTLIVLQELQAYGANITPPFDASDLISKFKLEENIDLFSKIVLELSSTTFLKHQKNRLRFSDVSLNSIHDKEIPESYVKGETYQFSFVGIIKVMGLTLIIYPKYIIDVSKDVENQFKKFKQILKVLELYEKRELQNLMASESEIIEEENSLSLAIQLLDYHSEYGLYTIEQKMYEESGEGIINWEKTINEAPLVFSGNSPLYLPPYTEVTNIDELHIIRMIQLAVMKDIRKNYYDILFLLDFILPQNTEVDLDDLGDIETLIYHLDNEINSQFITHKIELIRLLKLYLLSHKRKDLYSNLTFYGVTKFDRVWEDVCKKVYGDDLGKSLSYLGLKNTMMLDKSTLLKDVIEKPLWIDEKTMKEVKASKSLELDVLHVNKKEKVFEIYDAKYYLMSFKGNQIIGQPGIGDITKQYLYEQGYKAIAELNDYKFTNTFIIPKDELEDDKGEGVVFAKVSLPIFNKMGLSSIKTVARDSEILFELYLN
ncbi:LlaJI family restriction endonuclease [Aerococcaceae bacterium WS4759]|uniref:LlaJI family restriction endonuclease n=1 Tax=Fundicoccus ignavus TaxID=2664442 RepID=A0A6I2H1M9_9LACT|nr:LlaJI family restriction endonuclease [Fundicoccus ignavus]MRI86523.1 LlaJI family restriction endonuclease [Fundicoccus ignavus]